MENYKYIGDPKTKTKKKKRKNLTHNLPLLSYIDGRLEMESESQKGEKELCEFRPHPYDQLPSNIQ